MEAKSLLFREKKINRRRFLQSVLVTTGAIAIGRLPVLSKTQEEKLGKVGKQLRKDFTNKIAPDSSEFIEFVLVTKGKLKGTLNNISYYLSGPELSLPKECIFTEVSLTQKIVKKMFAEVIERELIDSLEEEFSQIRRLYSPELIMKTDLRTQLKEAGCTDVDIYYLMFELPQEGLRIVSEHGVKVTLIKSIEVEWSKEIEENIDKQEPSLLSHIGAGFNSLAGAFLLAGGISGLLLGRLTGGTIAVGAGLSAIGHEVEHFS